MVNRTIWIAWCLNTIEIEEISFSIHWLWRMFLSLSRLLFFSLLCVFFLFGTDSFSLSESVRVSEWVWMGTFFGEDSYAKIGLKKVLASNCATAVAAAVADISLPLTIWSHTIFFHSVVIACSHPPSSLILCVHSVFQFLLFTLFVVIIFSPYVQRCCFEQILSFYRINLVLCE